MSEYIEIEMIVIFQLTWIEANSTSVSVIDIITQDITASELHIYINFN